MNSDAANVLQWLMPSFLGCFAVTFFIVSLIARDLKSAFWGGMFFVTATIMLLAQSVLPLRSEWSIFIIAILMVISYFIAIKAVASRRGDTMPLSPFVISAIGLTMTSPLLPDYMPIAYHHAVLLALPSLILLGFLAERWNWRDSDLSEKLLYGSFVCLILLPSGGVIRMVAPQLLGININAPTDEVFLYILHAITGMTGPIFGTNLLLSIGVDLVGREEKRAKTDALTGLMNRYALDEALKRAEARNWVCGAAMVMDLDHFKRVNDVHGHAAGDEVLREVGRMMRRNIGDYSYLYRLGGEEFLVLVDEHQAEAAASMALMLRQATAALEFTPTWPDLNVTASIGLSLNAEKLSVQQVIKAADEAMYRAKKSGRNRVVAGHDHDIGENMEFVGTFGSIAG